MSFFRKKETKLLLVVIVAFLIIVSSACILLLPEKEASYKNDFGKGVNFDPNGVFESYLSKENTDVLENKALTVVIDKANPRALIYRLGDSAYMLGAGESTNSEYVINSSGYEPEKIDYRKTGKASAEYTLTFENVKLSGSVTKNITVCYELKLEKNEFVKRIKSIEGDDKSSRLWIEEAVPVLQVNNSMANAGVAASSTADMKLTDMVGDLSELNTGRISNSSFSFLWNNGIAAGIYTPSSFTSPYTAEVKNNGMVKSAVIYAGKYHHRLADGVRVQREDANGKIKDVFYEMRVGFVSDENATNSVDWQDAALWLKAEIPPMPEKLREYLKVGTWGQAYIAFPSSTYIKDSKNIPAFTYVHGTYEQYFNVQKNLYNLTDGIAKYSYCMVGWQGRGHDYGWPDLSEQIVNPAVGTTETVVEYQKKLAKYGGDLSFHINQSDISDASLVFNNKSKYGNSSVWLDKSKVNVGTDFFGWTAYTLSHFTDFINGYSKARQEAFVKKYFAPFIMYMDVFTDHPNGDYGTAEEQYAKGREVQHWRTLGTNISTEYYTQEKFMNGQFLFNTSGGISVVDSFMLAGNGHFNSTSFFNTAPEAYAWGYVGSGNITVSSTENLTASDIMEKVIRNGFLNIGILGEAGIRYYEETEKKIITYWNDGIKLEYDKGTSNVIVTHNGDTVAIGKDIIYAAPDGSPRAFVYCSLAREATWRLPERMQKYKKLALYELTADGRVYVDTLKVTDDSVTFAMKGKTSYVLVGGITGKRSARVNLAASSKITATSKDSGVKNNNNESFNQITLSVSKEKAPSESWNDTLKTLLPTMFDKDGGIKYEWPCRPYCTADGDINTWWQPNADTTFEEPDLADGEAYLEYKLKEKSKVSKIKITEISEQDRKVTKFEIQYFSGGIFKTIYSGEEIPEKEITFDAVETTRIRVVILEAQSLTPRIAEVEIYG
ncbi:MAG: hypothetical protein IKD04_05985 [Clostridia bacterium]|nr:hypothetical protein [Clostridia bacterium]